MQRTLGWFAPILAAIGCAAGATANAQMTGAYPTKPIRYIVPFPPGGMTDLISRIVAQRLGETIGQQVIIDNRSGAGGLVGTELAARAPADGYTIALGFLGTFAIAPHVYSRVPYDPRKDFTPVVELAESAYLVAVNVSTPAVSMTELIALARSRGALNYSSPGNGTPGHLASELLKNMTAVKLTHVPYKGSGPGLAAVISGETQLIIDPIASALPHVKAGKLRALAVTSNKRVPTLSELPTVTESGVPGYVVTGWYGVVMPAGAPRAVVTKLNADINRVLKQPAVRDPLASQAVELTGGEPAVFGRRIESEFTKWAKVVKDSGAKVD